jgi:hypothetical protein
MDKRSSPEAQEKRRQTLITKYGEDYFARIGSLGGKNKTAPSGFQLQSKEKLIELSRKGGLASSAKRRELRESN